MTVAWRDYRSAPAPGTPVCAAPDAGDVACVRLSSAQGVFPMIVVGVADGVRAWVNACPHQYLPLDYRSASILSADGARLMCSAHGAQFDAATGCGVAGEGVGCALDPVPVAVIDGRVVIAG